MNAKKALKMSLDWYSFYYKNNKSKIIDFTLNQISEYKKIYRWQLKKIRLFKPSIGNEEISNIKRFQKFMA